ncbi:hypothetical protein LEN_1039 [Lysobacter enzymogenes]|uniref:Uncharacterized protein n=1 Tax=Lysobacter enzymogenes TaxID=69 RepID=A0AAU9AN94_LYSEN|nr:hypothetical protein LEN_1039 [Lysobacter enzymogenes]
MKRFPQVVSEKRLKASRTTHDARRKAAGGGLARPRGRARAQPSSFIRTVTVGSGIGPDLLTPRGAGFWPGHSRRKTEPPGRSRARALGAYRRWGIAPRPEDVTGGAGRSRRAQFSTRGTGGRLSEAAGCGRRLRCVGGMAGVLGAPA